MSNPTITFRLSPYQLARGLSVIRTLEPNYKCTGISHIVKVIYFDYLAKMSLGNDDKINPELLAEVLSIMDNPGKASITLDDLISQESETFANLPDDDPIQVDSDKSSDISSVSDFSPPSDWTDE